MSNTISRFPVRQTLHIDPETQAHCKVLADRMGLSVSGVMRMLIRQAWEAQQQVIAAQHAAMRAVAHP